MKVPAAQLTQLVDPDSDEYWPAKQLTHALDDVDALLEAEVPATQLTQLLAELTPLDPKYDPATQLTQLVEP